ASPWQVQVLPDCDGYAEPPARDQGRTRRDVMPGPASAVFNIDAVEPPAATRAGVGFFEGDGGPVAVVLGRNPGNQAALRDPGRQLRGRSSVDRIPSNAGRDPASDSDRWHDEPEGNDDGDDPLHDLFPCF